MKRSVVEQCDLWGDYGYVLISGYAKRREDGRLDIDRIGPFLPPISFPRVVFARLPVVTHTFRERLVTRFPALHFEPVVKHLIVRLHWHEWPRDTHRPHQLPRDGEPESYIRGRPHDDQVAEEMPQLWEIAGPVIPGRLRRVEDPRLGYLDRFMGTIPPSNEQVALCNGRLVVTDVGREWLMNEVGTWIKICPVELQ